MGGGLEIDLARLGLAPGDEHRATVRPALHALVLGGQEYRARPDRPQLDMRVGRAVEGYRLRLRGELTLEGPCWRCLAPASLTIAIDADDYVPDPGTPAAEDSETEDFVDDGILDVGAWAWESAADALPATILCRPDCAGLCPACGADRNAIPDCGCPPPGGDERWAPLAALRESLPPED